MHWALGLRRRVPSTKEDPFLLAVVNTVDNAVVFPTKFNLCLGHVLLERYQTVRDGEAERNGLSQA